MFEEPPDIGPREPSIFVGVERDELGADHAAFVTSDGDSFALERQALELRIEVLRRQGLDTAEERKGLRALGAGS